MNISRWPKTDMRWYLGVRCRKCRSPILFALDYSEGSGGGQTASTGKLVLTCSLDKCKHRADYSDAAVSRYQKQPSTTPTPTGRNNEAGKGRKHKR